MWYMSIWEVTLVTNVSHFDKQRRWSQKGGEQQQNRMIEQNQRYIMRRVTMWHVWHVSILRVSTTSCTESTPAGGSGRTGNSSFSKHSWSHHCVEASRHKVKHLCSTLIMNLFSPTHRERGGRLCNFKIKSNLLLLVSNHQSNIKKNIQGNLVLVSVLWKVNLS